MSKDPETDTPVKKPTMVAVGNRWKSVDDPGMLEVYYEFDRDNADKTGYGFKVNLDLRKGIGAQFFHGDIITEIKVDGKVHSLKGTNELDVQGALALALKNTKTGSKVEVSVIRGDSSTPLIRSLGSSFANQNKVSGVRKIWDALNDRDNWRELIEHSKKGFNKTVTDPGTLRDKLTVDYIDKFRPVKKLFYGVTNILEKDMQKGSELYDALNVWGKIHTYLGIGHTELEQAQLKYHHPIMEALRETATDIKDVGQYLLARMAPSRNLHHRKQIEDQIADLGKIKDLSERKERLDVLNKRLENEAPSGISDEQARAIVQDLENPNSENSIRAFLDHKNNPLQLFYEQQREDL